MTPTLATPCAALPPEGAVSLTGLAAKRSRAAWGGPALKL